MVIPADASLAIGVSTVTPFQRETSSRISIASPLTFASMASRPISPARRAAWPKPMTAAWLYVLNSRHLRAVVGGTGVLGSCHRLTSGTRSGRNPPIRSGATQMNPMPRGPSSHLCPEPT